jgi:outer membrane protein
MKHATWLAATALCAANIAAQTAPQSLSLGDAARLAAHNSAPAVSARYRAEQARGRVTESRSALLPHASYTLSDGKRSFNTASFGLSFPGFPSKGLVIGPVRTADFRGHVAANLFDPVGYGRLLVSQSSVVGADIEVTQASQGAAAAAGGAYVRAMRGEAQVRARFADSALAKDLLDIAQRQVDAGVGVALDVTRARAQMAGIRSQLIAARSERDRANLELGRVLALESGTTILLKDTLGGGVANDPLPAEGDAVARAQSQRADVSAADAAAETARRGVWAVKAEYLPTIGVFGDDGTTSKDYQHLYPTYTYGVQISVPLFDGLRTTAHSQQANALLKEAQSRQHDLRLQVSTDVRSALVELAASREQMDAARERLSLGEQELAQARERFRAGVAGNADVITAQLNLTQARSQFVDALAAERMARVSLARSQGRVTELP